MERMLYRVTEVASFLGVSRGKAYQLINTGELRSVKIGGCRRDRVDDLRAYVEALKRRYSHGRRERRRRSSGFNVVVRGPRPGRRNRPE